MFKSLLAQTIMGELRIVVPLSLLSLENLSFQQQFQLSFCNSCSDDVVKRYLVSVTPFCQQMVFNISDGTFLDVFGTFLIVPPENIGVGNFSLLLIIGIKEKRQYGRIYYAIVIIFVVGQAVKYLTSLFFREKVRTGLRDDVQRTLLVKGTQVIAVCLQSRNLCAAPFQQVEAVIAQTEHDAERR
jgi:hypothetical protein